MAKKKKKIDPKSIDIPNICFSLTKEGDDREKRFKKQRLRVGFDDSETWSLSDTIANFTIPRLERFIKITEGMFLEREDFNRDCKNLLVALKLIARDNGARIFTEKEQKQVDKGLKVMGKVFMRLWW